MALLWERSAGGHLYEVRQAGKTVRLYRDGVLHTQHNPTRPLTLGVWDLLLLPAFVLPRPPRRVLMLGIGGGAALKMYQDFFPGVELTGVDLDALHLDIAGRFFGVEPGSACLHRADAGEWLVQASPQDQYDVIIEDIFTGDRSGPRRVFDADQDWLDSLQQHLAPGGVLVMNFASMSALVRSAWLRRRVVRQWLPGGLALRMPHYANAVGAFYRCEVSSTDLRRSVAANGTIARELRRGRFSYAVQALRAKQ